jgi:hypothetical protein
VYVERVCKNGDPASRGPTVIPMSGCFKRLSRPALRVW